MTIEIADRLVALRKQKGLSQEELAELLGVSRQAVSKWERAEASPDLEKLIAMAKLYGITLDELVLEQQEDEPIGEDNASESTNVPPEEKPQKSVDISWKNGVHVVGEDGEEVHVSWKDGVHVTGEDGEEVHIASPGHWNKHNDVVDDGRPVKNNRWFYFPYPIVALVFFFVWGFSGVFGGWVCSWMSFLTIPLYYTALSAVRRRKPIIFCYPVLALLIFFAWGFWGRSGGFALSWIVFLTVPFYYWLCQPNR